MSALASRLTKRVLGRVPSFTECPGTSLGRRVERIRPVFPRPANGYGGPKITAVLWRAGKCLRQNTMARGMHDHPLRFRVTRKYQVATNSRRTRTMQNHVQNQTFTADYPHPVRKEGSIERAFRTCIPKKLWDGRRLCA